MTISLSGGWVTRVETQAANDTQRDGDEASEHVSLDRELNSVWIANAYPEKPQWYLCGFGASFQNDRKMNDLFCSSYFIVDSFKKEIIY